MVAKFGCMKGQLHGKAGQQPEATDCGDLQQGAIAACLFLSNQCAPSVHEEELRGAHIKGGLVLCEIDQSLAETHIRLLFAQWGCGRVVVEDLFVLCLFTRAQAGVKHKDLCQRWTGERHNAKHVKENPLFDLTNVKCKMGGIFAFKKTKCKIFTLGI